jgi:hypothetical protein
MEILRNLIRLPRHNMPEAVYHQLDLLQQSQTMIVVTINGVPKAVFENITTAHYSINETYSGIPLLGVNDKTKTRMYENGDIVTYVEVPLEIYQTHL